MRRCRTRSRSTSSSPSPTEVPLLDRILYDEERGLRDYDHARLRPIAEVIDEGRKRLADPAEAAALERRPRRGERRRSRDHPLHLRHHRAAEGRDAVLRQRHRRGADRLRFRQALREGRDHRLPADRLGRRPHLLLRAGDPRRALRQLPGKPGHRGRGPARDRHHLRLRAAAGVRDHADPDHGAHGGRVGAEAADVQVLHRPRGQGRREDPQRRAGRRRGRPPALESRRRPRLRAAEEPLRAHKHQGRLHGGRGDRPGDLPLLPLDRRQPEAALRADRSFGLRHHAARRRDPRRHGRAARRRRSRSASTRTARCSTARPASSSATTRTTAKTAETKTADGFVRSGDAGFFDAERAPEDHRPRQGRRPDARRRPVPAEIRREQAEVLSEHQGGRGLRRRARLRRLLPQHRSRRGRQLGRAQRRHLRLLPGTRRPSRSSTA